MKYYDAFIQQMRSSNYFTSSQKTSYSCRPIVYNSFTNSPNRNTFSAFALLNNKCSKSRYFFFRSVDSVVFINCSLSSSLLNTYSQVQIVPIETLHRKNLFPFGVLRVQITSSRKELNRAAQEMERR